VCLHKKGRGGAEEGASATPRDPVGVEHGNGGVVLDGLVPVPDHYMLWYCIDMDRSTCELEEDPKKSSAMASRSPQGSP
jgi:hypothetical protein